MEPVAWSALTDDELWAGLTERIRLAWGADEVPVIRHLDEATAKAPWLERARGLLAQLDAVVPVLARGHGVFGVGRGVEVELGTMDVTIRVNGALRWYTMIPHQPAALVLAAVGEERWGERWLRALAQHGSSRPVARVDGDTLGPDELRWAAQNPGGPTPYTTAASEEHARLANIAEERGFEGVSALFARFSGEGEKGVAVDPAGHSGDAVSVDVDRAKLGAALRRNTRTSAIFAVALAVVAALLITLAVTDLGRAATFLLVSVLGLVLLANLGMHVWLRRRLRGFASITDPFIVVDDAGLSFAGVQRIPWSDVLGVIYSDETASLRRGGGLRRWATMLTYRGGGSQVALALILRGPKRYRDAARGDLRRYFDAALDMGGLVVPLDTALSDTERVRLRAALHAAAAGAEVGMLDTDDPARVAKATSAMMAGRPMNRSMRGVYFAPDGAAP